MHTQQIGRSRQNHERPPATSNHKPEGLECRTFPQLHWMDVCGLCFEESLFDTEGLGWVLGDEEFCTGWGILAARYYLTGFRVSTC